MQRRAVELVQKAQRPFVNPVRHQQHLDAFFAEDFELRAVFGGGQVVSGDVVNRFLAFFHARFVIGKTDAHGVAGGAGKTQQLGDLVFVGKVFAQTFFEHRAELGVKLGKLACVFFVFFSGISNRDIMLGQIFQHGQHASRIAFAYGFDVAAFLQQFTADVQGQIGRVHHAFDKAQIGGHQGFCVVHDEHAFHIQFDTGFFVAVPQIERRFARHIQQLCVFSAAFHAVVAPGQRVFKIVADGFVKLGVLFVADVFFRSGPQRAGFVDGFPFVGHHHFARLVVFAFFPFFFAHQYGQRNMVGVFANDGFEFPVAQVFVGVIPHVQDDVRAAFFLRDGFHLKVAAAAAGPAHALLGGQTGAAGFDHDFVGDDEAGIKTDAELTDQRALVFGVRLLVAGEFTHEVAGAAFGDGAQVVNRFLLAHAYAVVADGQGFGGLVKRDFDVQRWRVFIQGGRIQRFVAQFVAGVGGVGHQLAQKDFLVGIQRMGDQVQQLGDFGLEGMGMFAHGIKRVKKELLCI